MWLIAKVAQNVCSYTVSLFVDISWHNYEQVTNQLIFLIVYLANANIVST